MSDLSDDEIEQLASSIKAKMIEQFYSDFGRGVWSMVWKAIITLLVLIAAYGALKEYH